MNYQSVTLHLQEKTSLEPLVGVKVRVFNADGTVFQTLATSDSAGLVCLLLPAGATYSLRMWKFQTSFQNPQLITIPAYTSPLYTADAAYDIFGAAFSPPESTDPDMCRVSGFFRTPTGAAAPNVNIAFVTQFKPFLLGPSAILTERIELRTDAKGYVELDLLRCGCFDVSVEGIEGVFRSIQVPDAASANLPDLLFPYIKRIVFDPPAPWTIAPGGHITVEVKVYRSDGNETDFIGEHLTFYTADPNIAAIAVSQHAITIESPSNTTGTTTLEARPDDLGIVVLPVPVLVGVPATIEVVLSCRAKHALSCSQPLSSCCWCCKPETVLRCRLACSWPCCRWRPPPLKK